MRFIHKSTLGICAVIICCASLGAETLSLLNSKEVPSTFASMWQGFDPRTEELDVEILTQWEQEEVVFRVIRYRIGVFKGKKAMMAGIYGFPKGGKELPGLLQIHGGGQYAHHNAVLTNAKRGYATLSIAWAGRLSAPGYTVSPSEVKLFWDGKKDDPRYKLTTDWGVLDAYHAPSRYGKDAFPTIPAYDWSIDPVKSPRNNSWFLIALAGRRGLTFLERQPEVNGEKLGVYGHSMGGKLTVLISGADQRVKAAVPSCGGISDRYSEDDMHLATVSDPPSLKRITAPIMFLSPSNDFHGRINDLETAIAEIKSKDWRISCSPHHNHQDTPEYEVGTQLWFDQYLKNNFEMPKTPQTKLVLQKGSFPKLIVSADESREIESVDVYFTQQGELQERGKGEDHSSNTKHRFWQFVQPHLDSNKNTWSADLPIYTTDRPLWVYANVQYRLDQSVEGAGYYYGTYKTNRFALSSVLQVASSERLKELGVQSDTPQSSLIESFRGSWRKNWFSYSPKKWGIRTNKLSEPYWASANPSSRLSIEVKSAKPNSMVLWLDGFGTELKLLGNNTWQRFSLPPSVFKRSEGTFLNSWLGLRELRIDSSEKLGVDRGSKEKPVQIGGHWDGPPPQFRNLRWIN